MNRFSEGGTSVAAGQRPLRVCYFGTFRAGYARNQILISGLRQNGVDVIECHQTLWRGIQDRVEAASGGWLRPAFLLRIIRTYWKLLSAYRRVGDYDVMVLGYPGQLDVYLARLLTWLRRKPLVLDVFMSIYLIAQERGLTDQHLITGRLLYWIEKLGLLLPDRLIQDTAEYVAWFERTFKLDPKRFRLVPTGADDRVFDRIAAADHAEGCFLVLYYGTFIPNHGVEQIIEAARILKSHPDIQFELVGEGPTKARAMALAQDYGLGNVTFDSWIDKQSLPRKIAAADLCLGAFGTSPQSLMTIQNKIYEGLAMAKPVVTGDSPAIRAHLKHGSDVFLVPREDSVALAQAILALCDDPALRLRIAESGHRLYRQHYAAASLGSLFRSYLLEVVA